MTNALAQNIDNDKNSAIDTLMQAVNVSSTQKTQEDNSSEFSNLMNNLDARMQKAQNDFSQKAKVTNTSSINKKALEKKEVVAQNSSNIQKSAKKDTKETNNNINTTSETKNLSNVSSKNISKNTDKKINENKKITNENSNEINNTTLDTKDTQNLSDINNSSPVETSPVFPSDEQEVKTDEPEINFDEIQKDIEDNIKEIVNTLPIVSENSTNQIQDIKNNVEDLISSIEKTDVLEQPIEKVDPNLNNNANLAQKEDENILDNLKEIKKLFENILDNTNNETEFDETLSEIKNQTENLLNKINTEISSDDETLSSFMDENQIKDLKNFFKEIQTSIDEIKNNNETTKEIKNLVNDLKEILQTKDFKKLSQVKEKISEISQNINQTTNEKIDIPESDKSLKENLIDNLQKLNDKVSHLIKDNSNSTSYKNTENKIIEADFSKNIDFDKNLSNEIIEKLDNLTSKDFKNFDTKDKSSMEEILTTLQNIQDILSDNNKAIELKEQIETVAKEINTNSLSASDLAQNIEDLSDEIKNQLKDAPTNEVLTSDNTIDISDEFSNFNNSNNNNNNNNRFAKNDNLQNLKENLNLEDNKLELSSDDINSADMEINSKDIVVKSKSSQKIDLKNAEENIQKSIYTQEIMDEMMVEVNIKTIPSQSGALSVSDEIAKMAIGESNALNTTNSIHGSITYDSAGSNTIIKNPISLMKMSQTQSANSASMEDILNQIGTKISQMQNNSAQKLTMVLRPNDLGRLSIELTQNQNGLLTQILAQNDDVRAYIERNIDSLRQQLSDAGVNVNSIQIKTAGQEGSTQYDGNQNLNNQQENLEQQNNKQNQNHEHKNDNKEAKEVLASISNYEMSFKKDFSSILNNTLNYSLN